MEIAIPIFDKITALDAIGPYEVLSRRPGATVSFDAMLDWLRHAHAHSIWTTSVCTGALLLAAAGILEGLRATTHWLQYDLLRPYGVTPVAERIVREGKIITARSWPRASS